MPADFSFKNLFNGPFFSRSKKDKSPTTSLKTRGSDKKQLKEQALMQQLQHDLDQLKLANDKENKAQLIELAENLIQYADKEPAADKNDAFSIFSLPKIGPTVNYEDGQTLIQLFEKASKQFETKPFERTLKNSRNFENQWQACQDLAAFIEKLFTQDPQLPLYFINTDATQPFLMVSENIKENSASPNP